MLLGRRWLTVSEPLTFEGPDAPFDVTGMRIGDGTFGDDQIHGLIGGHSPRDKDAGRHDHTAVATGSAVDEDPACGFQHRKRGADSTSQEGEWYRYQRVVVDGQANKREGRFDQGARRCDSDHAQHQLHIEAANVLDVMRAGSLSDEELVGDR